MSNAAAPTAPPSVTHSYGANGGAQVCCHPAALDSRAMTQRLTMPPRTVQTMPVVFLNLLELMSISLRTADVAEAFTKRQPVLKPNQGPINRPKDNAKNDVAGDVISESIVTRNCITGDTIEFSENLALAIKFSPGIVTFSFGRIVSPSSK